jgi:prepilin-type N-terminal cleavage/methylation domain-containing protein
MRSKRIARGLRPPRCGRRAFTLIELLVVIAVVALLMAILFPALQAARKRTQAVKCQGTLRQWALYYSTYTSDNDYKVPVLYNHGRFFYLPGVLPLNLFKYNVYDPLNPDPAAGSHLDLHVYAKLLLCPATRMRLASHEMDDCTGRTDRPWAVGGRAEPMSILAVSSYGQNGWMPEEDSDASNKDVWTSCLVKGAASVPVYADCKVFWAHPGPGDYPPVDEDAPAGSAWAMPEYAMDRHHGGINSLFMDWSARKVGLKELWTLKWSPDFDMAGPWTKAGGVQPEQWPKWMRGFKDY